MGSLRTQHKSVAIAVSEDGGGTPVSLLWFRHELHTLGFQLANGPLDIVCPESDIHLCARLEPILKVEEYDPGFRSRDAKFNPALFLVEGLIRQEPKAKLLGIESQCPVLVGNWNASELHASNHIRCCPHDDYPDGNTWPQERYGVLRYSTVQHIPIDEHVIDVLLPDLTGHDRSPTAFLVYVVLWTALYREEQKSVASSLQELSERTGLSKTAVQNAVRVLKRRGLIRVFKTRPTAVPEYELVRHWVRRRALKSIQ
jgi:hypothetical protein